MHSVALVGLVSVTVLAVWPLRGHAAEVSQSFPVGEGGRLFPNPHVDQLLERPYTDDVPMACTGECLWAAHPSGWAFRNGVHYYLISPGDVGFDLRLESSGQSVESAQATFRPSHVRLACDAQGLKISGAKWITADDVLAAHLEIANGTGRPADLDMVLSLPTASVTSDGNHITWTRPRTWGELVFLCSAPGLQVQAQPAQPENAYWVEGESPVAQRGSDGPDFKPAASGGQVLGTNFGADENDFAEWRIEVRKPIEDAVLSVRYARAPQGDAEFKLTLGTGGTTVRHGFAPTGGWGSSPQELAIASFPLGKLDPGTQTIKVVAVASGSNVNFDLLCIHPAGTSLPIPPREETRLLRTLHLESGSTETVSVFLAVNTRREKAQAALDRVGALANPLEDQVAVYNAWLERHVPVFSSKDVALTKLYWHRATSILRKNLFRVGEGRLPRWGIAEGRWSADWYANMISYGAGHQVREARWLRDPSYVRDIITTWCENEKDNGVFPNFIQPDRIGDGQYTDWITSTAWDAYCVAPDNTLLRQWTLALERNVEGWLQTYDADRDGLLLVDSHWWTGMEWQPSFFFFNEFDKDRQDQALERVDLTAYVYGNAENLGRIFKTLGDRDKAAYYGQIAAKIRQAACKFMWDEATRYFYSVEPNTHEKALVKEVVGVYPFYFSMLDDERYAGAWQSILDPAQFWTPWPVASATKQCPAYSQDVTFNGKDVGGCMWNGPTWPHANSLVLSAMAATLREFATSPLHPQDFHALLRSYTLAQFSHQDLAFPWTGEYYNGDTGAWRTEQRDYDHSTFMDILIADMAGLRPRPDDVLEVHPLILPETRAFILDGIRYHDHDITIAWQPKDDAADSPDGLRGFRIYVDGKLVHHVEHVPECVELSCW